MNELDDKQSTNGGLRELALFAGAGGGILGGKLLGWKTVCAVERNAYAASVLCARQNDGVLETFPIWSDVCTFNGKPWRGIVDVVSGGFPCQDISAAGKGAGIDGKRSGLWSEMARIIGEVRPRFAFVENSPLLISRGLAVVVGDLAEMGYECQWLCMAASEVGAPHKRDRVWIVANPIGGERWSKQCDGKDRRMGRERKPISWDRDWQGALREFRGMDDGMAYGVERIDTIRNGQVPRVAATAFCKLLEK